MFPSTLGRYEVLGELGKGAMGVVYRARDPLIERPVAIKTFTTSGLPAEEVEAFERRFFREARLAGGLSHPNIVTVYDVGRSGELAYIAMEFLEGRSLREVLDSGVVLPVAKVVDWAAQVADGLTFAHDSGVVHRDIKPANLMVQANDAVKIADFGVALLPAGSITLAGTVFGSPKYMSPEQVVGKAVDGRSDIFSLGAVIYEMLTGRPAFGGEELTAILYQVLHTDPAPPSASRRDVPSAFDAIVARALAKDPAQRYQSAADLAADLRRLHIPVSPELPPAATVGDETIPLSSDLARAVAAQPPARGRRRPWLPVAAVLVVVAALLAVWGGMRAGDAPRRSAADVAVPVAAVPPAAVPAPITASPSPTLEKEPSPAVTPFVAAAPEATAGRGGLARLQVAVTPWGEVYVDGRKEGVSPPLRELRLAPGKHQIEIRNGGFPRYRQTMLLAPRVTVRVKHKFE